MTASGDSNRKYELLKPYCELDEIASWMRHVVKKKAHWVIVPMSHDDGARRTTSYRRNWSDPVSHKSKG
jgi:hypothetical protein